jgi:hypothetical protein
MKNAAVQAAVISGGFLLAIALMEGLHSCSSRRANLIAFTSQLQSDRFRNQAETLQKFAILIDRVRTDSQDLLFMYPARYQQADAIERSRMLTNQLIASRTAIDGPNGAGKDVSYSLKLYFPHRTPSEWREQMQSWGTAYVKFVTAVHNACEQGRNPNDDETLKTQRIDLLKSMWDVEDKCHQVAQETLSEWLNSDR